MPETTYDVFARVYDAWQSAFSMPFSEAVFPYYEEEILTRGVPMKTLVDLACGTGIFLDRWRWTHPEWRLLGTDGSSGMLTEARKRLGGTGAGDRVTLYHQQIQRTRLPETVGAAVCVFDSLNHLTRRIDLRRSLLSVAGSLASGGLFLFDLNDERSFPSLFEGSWTIESETFHATIAASHTPDGEYGTLRFTAFTPAGRLWRRHDFRIRERNWRHPAVRAALEEAGFAILRVRRIQPYPLEEVEAPRTLWICRLRPHRPRTGGTPDGRDSPGPEETRTSRRWR